jgi:hypothetical protein
VGGGEGNSKDLSVITNMKVTNWAKGREGRRDGSRVSTAVGEEEEEEEREQRRERISRQRRARCSRRLGLCSGAPSPP